MSKFYTVYAAIEYIDYDLDREITRRSATLTYFTEGELWNILSSVNNGLLHLSKN